MRTMFISVAVLLLVTFPAQPQPQAETQPESSGTETFVIGDATTPFQLDPGRSSSMIDFRILRGMYQTLVVFSDDGVTPEPGAAESWDVSEDGLTYTFHLRHDAKWSDGSSVTAEDFVAGWFRALMPDTGGDYVSLQYFIEGASGFYQMRLIQLEQFWQRGEPATEEVIPPDFFAAYDQYLETVGVVAVDDYTLRVTLERPTPFFLSVLSMPCFAPIPSTYLDPDELIDHHGMTRVDPALFADPDRVICNGPYSLSSYDAEGDVVLIANAHYWDAEHVKAPRIHLRILRGDALLAAYERGEVDWVPSVWPADRQEALLASGRDDVHVMGTVGTYYYEFNCRAEVDGRPNPFADRTLRRAFAHAMDREALCEMVGSGTTPMGTFIPPGIIVDYAAPMDAAIPYDVERSVELLAESGYPNGEGLAGFDLLVTDLSVHVPIAQYLKEEWAEALGVTRIVLRQPGFAEYLDECRLGHFHVRRAGWFGDFHDPTTFLDLQRRGTSNNYSGYDSDAFNALMDAADAELDVDARLALLREAESILLQDAVVVPLYRYGTVSLFDPERVHVPLNAWNYIRLEHLELLHPAERASE